jgi:hypothetical protein
MLAAFEVVVVRATAPVRPADARRLAARARERGSVLVRLGPPGWWPEVADVSLAVTDATWTLVGDRHRDVDVLGRGHLRARRVTVEATGRRGAVRPRTADLWLPGPSGQLAPAEPLAEVRPLVPVDRADRHDRTVRGRRSRPLRVAEHERAAAVAAR